MNIKHLLTVTIIFSALNLITTLLLVAYLYRVATLLNIVIMTISTLLGTEISL